MLNPIRSRRPSWRRITGMVFVFVLFAGMLFWTKLRLVSDIPRSAYAVPKDEQPEQQQTNDDHQHDSDKRSD